MQIIIHTRAQSQDAQEMSDICRKNVWSYFALENDWGNDVRIVPCEHFLQQQGQGMYYAWTNLYLQSAGFSVVGGFQPITNTLSPTKKFPLLWGNTQVLNCNIFDLLEGFVH